MTHYNDTPWSFSSEKAQLDAGLIREYKPRHLFKL